MASSPSDFDQPTPWAQRLRALGVELPRNRRVLLVDDETPNLEVLSALLEDEFDVLRAESGPQALTLLARTGAVAAIVADQRMPGMTGVELLTDVARRYPETVRMVLTGYSDVPPIVAAINEGRIYSFHLKPWNADEMRSVVRNAVWLYEARMGIRHLVAALSQRRDDLAGTLDRLRRSEHELLSVERMSTLGRFTAGITHNVRNSLTVMMNLLELVQQSPGELSLLRSAQTAFQSLDALLRLVSDINALAQGQIETARRSTLEMGHFIEQTLHLFRLEPLGKNRPIKVTICEHARVLELDPARSRQALMALLRNAAQASAIDTPIELSVTVDQDLGSACIEVRDRGGGIDSALADEAARPFGAPSETPTAALGIGLELVRLAAQAHGGRLLISGTRGRGTIAQLWLGGAIEPDENALPATGRFVKPQGA